MSRKKETTAIVGVGVDACAACCASPIVGVLAAIGLGTAVGFAIFGAFAILVGAALTAFVLVRRRRRAVACARTEVPEAVPVELIDVRARS